MDRHLSLSATRGRDSQRGGVLLVVALSLTVLLGAVGLAVDGGRLYTAKTELQNAADACALAASHELSGAVAPDAFDRAEAAGRLVAMRHKVDFQGSALTTTEVSLAYAASLGGAWVAASTAGSTARHVRCSVSRAGLKPFLMQILGQGDTTLSATATATLVPGQTGCALPLALCARSADAGNLYGFVRGAWYELNMELAGTALRNYLGGDLRWIDADPSRVSAGCSGGAADELACLLGRAGQCSMPAPTSGTCLTQGNSAPASGCVALNTSVAGVDAAYATRFGLYSGAYSVNLHPPDLTGRSFDNATWGAGQNAYTGGFRAARAAHDPIQSVPGGYSGISSAQHLARGTNRRLAVVPVLDCHGGFTVVHGGVPDTTHVPVRAYACVLLLNPLDTSVPDVARAKVEFLGLANEPDSPCASLGPVGSAASLGPLVPALAQ